MKLPIYDHLGDGAYVEFDGYNIILKANHHEYPTDKVCLEPQVLENFLNFIKRVRNEINNSTDDNQLSNRS